MCTKAVRPLLSHGGFFSPPTSAAQKMRQQVSLGREEKEERPKQKERKKVLELPRGHFRYIKLNIDLQLILKQDDMSLTHVFCECKINKVH